MWGTPLLQTQSQGSMETGSNVGVPGGEGGEDRPTTGGTAFMEAIEMTTSGITCL